MRYHFIQAHQEQFSLAALCRVMQVGRSGYYAWRTRPPSQHAQEQARLLEQIKNVHEQSDQTYGSPRIYKELREVGVACSQKRVAHLMRAHQLCVQTPPRFVLTTDSRHDLPVADNLLDRHFEADQPNTRWCCDFTYIWTRQGWLYLAVVLDLFSRRIVGWAMQANMEASLVIGALNMALQSRQPPAGLLCHSDRGSQYASRAYQEQMQQAGLRGSMSRKGNCWDNAPAEAFFATLKRELVHRCTFESREQARTAVFRWIETWYNRKRRHSTLGYVSPEVFEQQQQQQQSQRQNSGLTSCTQKWGRITVQVPALRLWDTLSEGFRRFVALPPYLVGYC